jgi:hypothetical protein
MTDLPTRAGLGFTIGAGLAKDVHGGSVTMVTRKKQEQLISFNKRFDCEELCAFRNSASRKRVIHVSVTAGISFIGRNQNSAMTRYHEGTSPPYLLTL